MRDVLNGSVGALAARRTAEAQRRTNLGLPHTTMGEAYVRLYLQTTGVLA
ncbi:hypothetical protein [Streptomyces pseudoechinosporeus]